MSAYPPASLQALPTLTEVVEWRVTSLPDDVMARKASNSPELAIAPSKLVEAPPVLTQDQLVQRVLGEVQHQVDLMLEVRLREVLSTILARTADTLVRDARSEMTATLRDIVTRAVEQEMARERARPSR